MPPRDLPEAALYAIQGQRPQTVDELASHYQRLLVSAIEAWRSGSMDEAQAAFLDSFVRNGFLPATLENPPELQARADAYRKLEDSLPHPHYAPSVLQE